MQLSFCIFYTTFLQLPQHFRYNIRVSSYGKNYYLQTAKIMTRQSLLLMLVWILSQMCPTFYYR